MAALAAKARLLEAGDDGVSVFSHLTDVLASILDAGATPETALKVAQPRSLGLRYREFLTAPLYSAAGASSSSAAFFSSSSNAALCATFSSASGVSACSLSSSASSLIGGGAAGAKGAARSGRP